MASGASDLASLFFTPGVFLFSIIINNLKDGDNDVLFAVISQYDGDVICINTINNSMGNCFLHENIRNQLPSY